MLALRIPHTGATCTREDCCLLDLRRSGIEVRTNWQWVVVVRSESSLGADCFRRGRSMVLCWVWCAGRMEGARSWLQRSAIASDSSVWLNCARSHVGGRRCCRVADRWKLCGEGIGGGTALSKKQKRKEECSGSYFLVVLALGAECAPVVAKTCA